MILGAGTFAQATFSAVAVGLPALGPALRSHYRLTLGETGVVLAAVGIGMLVTLLAWGLLADRLSERVVIAAGLTAAGAALAAAGTTTTFAPLVGVLFLAGALGASVNAASGRAVMGWFPAGERGMALGVRQTAIPIGGASAAAALPWLADAGGTRLAFAALGGGCVAGAVVAAAFIRETPAPAAPLADIGSSARDARAWWLGAGSSLYLTSQIAITGFVVLFLHDHRGVHAGTAAALLAGMNVLSIGARIASGRWSDRIGVRIAPMRWIGVALVAATAAVAASVDAPLGLLVPVLLVGGVLSMAWNGLAVAAAAEGAAGGRVGAAIGFQQTLLGVMVAVAPPAFAVVAGSSWRLAFALAALGPLLGIAALHRVAETTPAVSAPLRRSASAGSSAGRS